MNDEPDDEALISADLPNIWDIINPVGRPVAYEPNDLWVKAVEYFKWCQGSPLKEQKVFGTGLRMEVKHPKAFTKQGFCAFAEISPRTFDTYAERAEYQPVTEAIRQVMYDQVFSAAAVGLMNANLIGRQLGLAERIRQEVSASDMTDEQLEERYEELRQKGEKSG